MEKKVYVVQVKFTEEEYKRLHSLAKLNLRTLQQEIKYNIKHIINK